MKATNYKSNSKKIKISLLLAGFLVQTTAFASELSIADKLGGSLLRVETSDSKNHDIQVLFKQSSARVLENETITLSSSVDSSSDIKVNITQDDLLKGLVISGVNSGKYTVSLSSSAVEIKEIKMLNSEQVAKSQSEDSEISSATYALGAAALGGAALAVSAGSNDDIFGGSSRNSARSGSGNNSGSGSSNSSSSGQSSQVGSLAIPDSNYPTATPIFVATPSTIVTNPAPPARDTTGGGIPTPTPTPAPNPTIAPPPAVTDPMTPS